MRRLSVKAFTFCWVFCSVVTWAGSSNFAAKVPVASQSASDRRAALSEALASVLVKVSGSVDAPATELGIKALANADQYVSQFRYLQANEQEREEGVELFLKADFDSGRVRDLIKSSGATVWPENRPQVLIWAIADTPQQGRNPILDPEHPLVKGMLERAASRGLPALLPLWDLDDQILMSNEALWGLDDAAIMAASARYDVNTVLAARYSQASDGRWFANWQLHHIGEVSVYETQALDSGVLAASAVDPVVAYLAKRYAISASNDEGEVLQVLHLSGIGDYESYQRALKYLNALPLIGEAKLVAMRNDYIVLHVSLSGSWEQLNNALALDRKVASVMGELGAMALSTLGSPDDPARYTWVN